MIKYVNLTCAIVSTFFCLWAVRRNATMPVVVVNLLAAIFNFTIYALHLAGALR